MKRYLNAFFYWLVLSSKDSKKVSMTMKSVLVGGIAILASFGIDTTALPQGVDMLVDLTEKVLILVSSVAAFIGFVRKIRTTLLGTNAVLNDGSLR